MSKDYGVLLEDAGHTLRYNILSFLYDTVYIISLIFLLKL